MRSSSLRQALVYTILKINLFMWGITQRHLLPCLPSTEDHFCVNSTFMMDSSILYIEHLRSTKKKLAWKYGPTYSREGRVYLFGALGMRSFFDNRRYLRGILLEESLLCNLI